jgi:hypothetical protein
LSNIIIRSTDLGDNNITCDFTVNETKNSVTGLAHFKNNVNYFIFANNNTGNAAIAENHSAFKLYSFKMTDNGILVRNFIPCKRKSDNIAGLYDLIGQQFYRSITGTDLTAGHEINSSGGSTSSEVIDDVIVSYTFNGWYSNPECDGDAITQAYNLTTAGKVYNVYAKWI